MALAACVAYSLLLVRAMETSAGVAYGSLPARCALPQSSPPQAAGDLAEAVGHGRQLFRGQYVDQQPPDRRDVARCCLRQPLAARIGQSSDDSAHVAGRGAAMHQARLLELGD